MDYTTRASNAHFLGCKMLIKEMSNIKHALHLIANSDVLALDIETDSLNVRKGKIIGIGLSNGTDAVYLAHLAWNGEQLEELLAADSIRAVLSAIVEHKTKLVCHNGSFDLRFIYYFFGCNLIDQLWSDSLLIKHTCNEEHPFGLKEIATQLFGISAKDEQLAMKESIKANGGSATEYYKADLQLMAKYCIQDCNLTLRINNHYLAELEKQKLTRFYFELEVMPLYRLVTVPMEMAGIPVDIEALKKAQIDIAVDIAKLEGGVHLELQPHLGLFTKWFLNKDYPVKTTGPFVQTLAETLKIELPKTETGKLSLTAKNIATLPEAHIFRSFIEGRLSLEQELITQVQLAMHGPSVMLNLNSKHHLKKIFFDTLKETPLSRTPTGLPQVDEEFMDSVAHKHSWVRLLIDYNKLNKIKSTYIDRFIDEQEDGIWYPSFYQHRTVSGRHGSDAQQMSRKLEVGQASEVVIKYTNMIRDFMIPSKDYTLVGADYESLEPKVFAHVSGDDRLKRIFKEGLDFYSEIAIRVEKLQGVSSKKDAPNYLGLVNKAARQKAKSYALGVVYGMTGYKMQFEIGCTQEEGEQLVADYLEAFPDLHDWMKRSQNLAKSNGFIASEAGRIRHLPKAKWMYIEHGDQLLNSLWIWKQYHEFPVKYEEMKKKRSEYKNQLNNALNFQIQSLAASIVSRAGIAMSKAFKVAGLKAKLALVVHDEYLVHCPKEEEEKVKKIMQECMENTYQISVPLVAIPHSAQKYGDLK